MNLSRRDALLGVGASSALYLGPRSKAAAATAAPRLVVINVRGGIDGLALVAPYGDAALKGLRASLMSGAVGTAGGMLDLGGFFGLHPLMTNFYNMFLKGEALAVHAVGNCSYTRSHFDGQDFIQSGAPQLLNSGWLNRAASLISASSGALPTGMSMDASTPLLLQGPTAVAGWMPNLLSNLSPTLSSQILALNASDKLLGPAFQTAMTDYQMITSISNSAPWAQVNMSDMGWTAFNTAKALLASNGSRVASFETGSFDTHDNQVAYLQTDLAKLDETFGVLKSTLGSAWANTIVLTLTEFGRTAAVNGSGGTDHGTGFAMLMAGGGVAGGKVVSTWPGLSSSKLYQGRDLQPTVDVRSVLMSVLIQHLGLPASSMATVFPNAGSISPLANIVRS